MTSSARYHMGIDTGGTYTDAVVLDAASHRVIASAKALTTRGDLAVGVIEAIERALAAQGSPDAAKKIALVSVSTTLATNALVEGHGSTVAAILAGFDDDMVKRAGLATSFPGMPIAMLAGGHDHNGSEMAPLDMAGLEAAIASHGPAVEAFAVASRFAVRNPAHEAAIRERIETLAGKPVTLSSELSSALDAPRRALTAVLNARLIARISHLVKAVEHAMHRFGIEAPLMVAKGDGTLALAEAIALRPIETVLSGPAASLVGAAILSGRSDFLMSDMGGTTTDLGILRDGRPKIREDGAEVGGWRTMVRAIDVRTIGLGGDSEVAFNFDGSLKVGPQRVVPVSLLASRFPKVLGMLETDRADAESGSFAGRFVLLPLGQAQGAGLPEGLAAREREVLALVGPEPKPLRAVVASSAGQRTLSALARRGLVQIGGFTPSDAAHVLNLQDNWSRDAAVTGAALAFRHRTMRAATRDDIEALSREVCEAVVRLSARVVLSTALGIDPKPESGDGRLIEAVSSGAPEIGIARFAIGPSVPVIAVGGPVKVYYGEVGRRLGCEMVFPEACEVANAVGAAAGVIARQVTVEVAGDGSGLFRVHAPDGVASHTSPDAALAAAESHARTAARSAVLAMGGGEPEIRMGAVKHYLPDSIGESGLLQALVTAEAIARPLGTPGTA